MGRQLLILGAGDYGAVAREIAESTGEYEKIEYADDGAILAADGREVFGKISDLELLAKDFTHVAVAIGAPQVRLSLIERAERIEGLCVATLISPLAYVSPSAQIQKGCIIEPMAVIHAGVKLGVGCIISAGAVINHVATCCDGVHVDCNATVAGRAKVAANTKVPSGTVYQNSECI